MKTQRSFASLCLLASFCALVAATNVSVGQQPGVVKLTSGQESFEPPTPVPPAMEHSAGSSGFGGSQAGPTPGPIPDYQMSGMMASGPMYDPAPPIYMNQQPDYTPYFGQSGGVTESPVLGRMPQENPLFGPVLMWESNIGDGLGFGESYHRLNARLPYHVVPGNSVLMADLSASMTDTNQDLFNVGVIWRNYDAMRNRVFGWNAYWDSDDGRGSGSAWERVGVGVESLGKYIDFRANGYWVSGNDSVLLDDQLVGALSQVGNTVQRIRNQRRDNAYSGFDVEAGGPLPFLGRRGCNLYAGAYLLDNDYGYETVGFSARFQALVTSNATLDLRVTEDDTFGTNAWFSVSYTIPNYFEDKIFEPKNVRDRLADPVYRSNRVHSNIDVVNVPEAIVNAKTGLAWNIAYVDPNRTAPGTGTFESPYSSLQAAANANNPLIDVIQVAPRADDTGTNLTVNGGMTLFECQALVSSVKDYTLFTEAGQDFVLPGTATATGLGPLVSNPTMGVGGSVIRVTNENTIQGLRIDAGNAAGTVFGTGITNPLPSQDLTIACNTIFNYSTAINLQDVSGNIIIEENTLDGTAGTSVDGLVMTTPNGSLTNLLLTNNIVNDNTGNGLSVTVGPNATLNADDPSGVSSPITTGITNNSVTNSGDGIVVSAQAGSQAFVVADDNVSSSNTGNGFVARSDGATFVLSSLSGNVFDANGANGAFLHYLNGGTMFAVSEDVNEDLNFNGILDVGEDLDLDGILDVPDGILTAGEDLNGNSRLDLGIVANTFSNNTVAGLCIFGEDSGSGIFDIGGQQDNLTNSFIGNTGAGIAVDLTGTATAQTNTINNLITADLTTSANPSLTFVLDFWETSQGASFTDPFGNDIGAFDLSNYGFVASDFDLVTTEILNTVRSHYYSIPTTGADARSPIPDGQQLAVDFVIGDLGSTPANGATDYYTVVLGDTTTANTPLGIAFLNSARTATGGAGFAAAGDHISSVYTNNISTLGGLTPADALTEHDIHERYEDHEYGEFIHGDIAGVDENVALADALTSGNLTFTANAIAGTTSHEIGHTLSLLHIDATGAGAAVTPSGTPPIMGTGAIDLSNQARIGPREFSYTGQNTQAGGAVQTHVAQLASALGTRDALQAGVSGDGITINVSDSARLLPSNFINNRIERNNGSGIEVIANDSAQVEGLTIQGNTIQANTGRGIDLIANGPGAVINASNTIGGTGTNVINGLAYSEGNVITGNQSDGIRALAQDGGTVLGNAYNNIITNNAGNGMGLYVADSGTVDFGTPASNRIIEGNTITGNGGKGIELVSTVAAGQTGVINAVVQGNTISNNVSGGVTSLQTGPGIDNTVNLTIGGTSDQTNTIDGNGDVGVGFEVAGNAKGVFSLTNSTISGTTDGGDPLTFGDGIYLRRSDSSLLQATIENVTSTNNAGNGMLIETQGNDKNDPNQPMSGTVNTVDWNNSVFDNNGINGVAIRTRGDSMLIADGSNNFTRNNAEQGIDIETTENSSFGDSTDGLPPGRRVVFDGFTVTGNGVDGLWATASEGSQLLLEITSNRVAGGAGAHAALNTTGDSNYSNNGTDGIHIDAFGNSTVDVKITAETPVTETSGRTYVQNNGTNGGASGGIFVATGGTATGIVNVVNTVITGTQAFGSEDVNGNGILDPGEDLNGNEDIDVAGGDGISYNVTGQSSLALVVGGVGEGNVIQNNEDDGIAITATGSGLNTSRPTVVIANNIIGGEANGVQAGNAGDGVSLNVQGGTATAVLDDTTVDLSLDDGDGITFGRPGLQENGPIVQLTASDNLISNNGQRGVNLLFNGSAGERNRENGNSFVDPGLITLTNNTIISNGTEGVFYRGDSDMNQGRFAVLSNTGFTDDDRPRFGAFYDPLLPEFQIFNVGSVNGTTAFGAAAADGEAAFLNLRTVQNTFLTVTGNAIQNNGVGTVTGEGLVLSVGTGAYLAADVRDNTFGGNLEEDVRTESFLSTDLFYSSIDQAGNLTFDAVFLDDSAQLDMRFSNNTGNQIAPSFEGATYTDNDVLKRTVLGFNPNGTSGVTDRDAALFQIDDGGNLDNPNNTFINFGLTQDIDGAFSSGGFNLRAGADAAFPNIGFAPFLP